MTQVGWIGMGAMGRPMVARLVEAGHSVTAYDVNPTAVSAVEGVKPAGTAAEAARSFAKALEERSGLPVVLWDERLSTTQAARALKEAGLERRKQRQVVDKVAAAVVLRSYLDSKRGAKTPEPPLDVADTGERATLARPRPRDLKRRAGRPSLRPVKRRDWRDELSDLDDQ